MITRRDFLNGVALGVGAGLTPASWLAARAAEGGYPPALLGLRGSHDGSFETAHRLARDGERFEIAGLETAERYDLVVVGAGLAGLAAAHRVHAARPGARILIVDPHDDFGGHAKRNEFAAAGRLLIGYGGSESFQSPRSLWSPEALSLLRALAVALDRFEDEAVFHRRLYPDLGLSCAVFFDRENFGVDRLVPGDPCGGVADGLAPGRSGARPWPEVIAEYPVSAAAKDALLALTAFERDPLADMTEDARESYLTRISYADFLRRRWALPEEALACFWKRTHDAFAGGIDVVPAAWAAESGYPGFAKPSAISAAMREAERDDPYVHHFPDGNAGLARLLVKAMIPEVGPAAPGMDGIVLDRFDYALLDREGRPVRLRLSTTAVRVEPHGGGVAVGLVGVGGLRRIEADAAILACNAGVIPALCPALRDAQKAALLENVRLPLVYANVVVRDWTSFQALTVHSIAAPMAFWSLVKLDFPVSLGGYAFPKTPDEPMVLHMVHAPMEPIAGATQRDQARIGRAALLETPFESYEARILDQLDRMLGPGGFVAARDVLAITVNRWPHGYSYYANPLFDDEEAFAAIAARTRTPFGRIAIGLSDTGFDPYAHTAIDEGLRAAGEVLAF